MEFGEWLQQERKKSGLDIRTFAELTGVDGSTISRTENQHTQVTFYTAFRICEGLKISPANFFDAFLGRRSLFLDQREGLLHGEIQEPLFAFDEALVLSVEDIERLVSRFLYEEKNISEHLAQVLNELRKRMYNKFERDESSRLIPLTPSDISQMLFRSPIIFRPEISYPGNLDPTIILDSYENKGAIMLHDVEYFLSRYHVNTRLRLSNPFQIEPINSLERIKLIDVLKADGSMRVPRPSDGKIIGMFWEACRFYERLAYEIAPKQLPLFDEDSKYGSGKYSMDGMRSRIVNRQNWEVKLAILYLTIYRWCQDNKMVDEFKGIYHYRF